jgi:hypothetical protein
VERVKGYQQTFAYQKAMNKRKVWVEPLFAEGKQWHGMGRFRLRRLWRVNCEALMMACGQNLKRLLQKRGWGRRPFPAEAVALAPPGNWEPEELPRHTRWKSDRLGIAVASLLACGACRTVIELQTRLCSRMIRKIYLLHIFIVSALDMTLYHVLAVFAFLALSGEMVEPSRSSAFS